MGLLKQLGVAIKPAWARLLKRKLQTRLRLLAWDNGGKSCDTYEQEIRALRRMVDEATGGKLAPASKGF